jgi:bacterioferritin (cytochrome b1)
MLILLPILKEGKIVQFIKPKNNNAEKVDWLISEQVREIVKNYAEFCEYSESEVVDMFLKNLLEDEEFLKWIDGIRNNKRMIRKMGLEDVMEGQKLG